MVIKYLCDFPEHVETISSWIYNEFVVNSKSTSTLSDIVNYFSKTSVDKYPITFIAIKDSKCVGVVSIFENDLKSQDKLKPWLAALYVEPTHRGRGIAKVLIDSVLEKTKKLGFSEVYLRTEHTADYYKSKGWDFVFKTNDEKDQETEVFKYRLET